MRTFDQWMDEYSVSHQNHTNQMIHKICVPLIMLTVLGFLWCLPVPSAFLSIPYLNWATIVTILALAFYLSLNFKMFLGMVVQSVLMLMICHYIYEHGNLLVFSAVVFVLSWIGQFWGHKIEGKKPSFLKDLVFLLIGPLWVNRFLYKKLGITV